MDDLHNDLALPWPAKRRPSMFSRPHTRKPKTLEQSVAALLKMVDPSSHTIIPRHVQLTDTTSWHSNPSPPPSQQLIKIIDIRCLSDMVVLGTFDIVLENSRRAVGRHVLEMSETQRTMRFYALLARYFQISLDLRPSEFPSIAHSVVLINNNNVNNGAQQSFELVGMPDSTKSPELPDEGAKDESELRMAERHRGFRQRQIFMRQAMELARRCADDAYENCPILVQAMEEMNGHVWPIWPYMVDDYLKLLEHERKMKDQERPTRRVRFSDQVESPRQQERPPTPIPFDDLDQVYLERESVFRLHTHCMQFLHNGHVPPASLKLFLHTVLFAIILFNEKTYAKRTPRRESQDSALTVDPPPSPLELRASPIPTLETIKKKGLEPIIPGSDGQPIMDKEGMLVLVQWNFANAMGQYLANRHAEQALEATVERARKEKYVRSVEVSPDAEYRPICSDDKVFHEMVWRYVRERYYHRKEFCILVIDEAVREYNAILQDIRFKHKMHAH